MELKRGLLVRSKAGHDKHGFLWCCRRSRGVCRDLRRKAQAAPATEKRKNCRHLAVTNTVLPEEAMKTNREIRRGIRCYLEKDPQS